MIKDSIELSLIVPVYNGEKFVEDCLQSVLSVTAVSMEVIAVDDGSTDRTPQILDTIAQSDARVRVIHKENGGVSAARNAGLDAAQGNWVMFADADDTVNAQQIENLVAFEKQVHADIVIGGYRFCGLKEQTFCFPQDAQYQMDSEEQERFALTHVFLNPVYCDAVWNKLFRRSFLGKHHIRFEDYDTINSEDQLFNITAYARAERIATFNGIIYHYHIRSDSLSRGKHYPNTVEQNCASFAKISRALISSSRFAPEVISYYLIRMINNIAVQSVVFNRERYRSFLKIIKSAKKKLLDDYRSHVHNNVRWLYILGEGRSKSKYRLLDLLVIHTKGSVLLGTLLFIFGKYRYKVEEHY